MQTIMQNNKDFPSVLELLRIDFSVVALALNAKNRGLPHVISESRKQAVLENIDHASSVLAEMRNVITSGQIQG